ncbi:unnamed protein product, partial [Cyprideis torosa]
MRAPPHAHRTLLSFDKSRISFVCFVLVIHRRKALQVPHLRQEILYGTAPQEPCKAEEIAEEIVPMMPHQSLRQGSLCYLRRFSCTLCGKAFVLKGAFDRHLLTHDKNTKVHKCTTCGKAFRRNENLKRHRLRLHGVSP